MRHEQVEDGTMASDKYYDMGERILRDVRALSAAAKQARWFYPDSAVIGIIEKLSERLLTNAIDLQID